MQDPFISYLIGNIQGVAIGFSICACIIAFGKKPNREDK